jgi:DNA-binding cell septation regulator SpoVG
MQGNVTPQIVYLEERTMLKDDEVNIPVSDIQVRLVEEGSDGLLAFASCVVAGGLKINNIAIRRGKEGSLFLTYPSKQSSKGTRHPYFHPITSGAAKAVENAVLARLATLARAAETGAAGTE